MSYTVLSSLQSAEFDRFLFAPVGEEENGMTLSLLSALARLNIDPWEETALLAAIPKERAKLKLTAIIATTTKALRNAPSAELTAARLVELLPGSPITTVAANVNPVTKSDFVEHRNDRRARHLDCNRVRDITRDDVATLRSESHSLG